MPRKSGKTSRRPPEQPKRDSRPKIVVASSEDGDWSEIYIDGKSAYGNHSIGWWQVLDILGIEYDTVEVPYEWAEEHGFPKEAKDLPK